MLASLLSSRWSVGVASLALLAFCGGCGTDCANQPLGCNESIVYSADLCKTPGRCQVDGAPATCSTDGCRVAGTQTLTIDVTKLDLSSLPNVAISIGAKAGAAPAPEQIEVAIDGAVGVVDQNLVASFPQGIPSSAKTFSLTAPANAAPLVVRADFEDLSCQEARGLCHGGGE
jgi:hypothetical protein